MLMCSGNKVNGTLLEDPYSEGWELGPPPFTITWDVDNELKEDHDGILSTFGG